MKTIFIISALALFIACGRQKMESGDEANLDSLLHSLIETDLAWSREAQEKGYYQSRINFVDAEVILLQDEEMPIAGAEAVKKFASENSDTSFSIQWRPLRAYVAASGDFGYTYGAWTEKLNAPDTTIYGNYITVWKKQEDGSWKVLADAGGETPEEVK
jgi:ketosteroid isomerase-like protein